MSTKLSRRGAEYFLMIVLGAFHTGMQGINLMRGYAYAQLGQRPLDLYALLRETASAWLIGLAFIFLIVRTTRFLLWQQWSWWRIIGVHLVIGLIFSVLWYSSLILMWNFFCEGSKCNEPFTDLVLWYVINLDKLLLLYSVTVSVTYLYYYVRRAGEYRLQQLQLNNQLTEARLKSLRSQLHPHFLFNTLNSISSLMDENIQGARRMISELGELLRTVLSDDQRPLTSLRDELTLLESYTFIEKTRFSDDLQVDWEIDPAAESRQVPNMILQPLVENAIRHGFDRDHLHLDILIRARVQEDGQLRIEVCDNGRGPHFPLREGAGLRITRQRLQALYGDEAALILRDQNPGLCCIILLPPENR